MSASPSQAVYQNPYFSHQTWRVCLHKHKHTRGGPSAPYADTDTGKTLREHTASSWDRQSSHRAHSLLLGLNTAAYNHGLTLSLITKCTHIFPNACTNRPLLSAFCRGLSCTRLSSLACNAGAATTVASQGSCVENSRCGSDNSAHSLAGRTLNAHPRRAPL